MKQEIYGFRVSNIAGQGFERWYNSPTKLVETNENGEIPGELKRIAQAQDVMSFNKAYEYSKIRANNLDLYFNSFGYEDYKKLGSPVKQFFRKILK